MAKWRDDLERRQSMLWVTGPAGSGKSAIAQTFGEDCQRVSRLGAALFFSHSNGRGDIHRVIPTLAHQLAIQAPSYKYFIAESLVNDPTVLERSLSTQFRKLIWEPTRALQSSHSAKPLVIILDGLNECYDRDAQLEFLGLIDGHIRSYGLKSPFLWVICVRPEPFLMRTLVELEKNENSYCEHVGLSINSTESVEDVARMFYHAFSDIRERYADTLDLDKWPVAAHLERLVNAASGFFFFASVIVEFVGNRESQDPVGRLAACLNVLDSTFPESKRAHPFHPLDDLYRHILFDVHKDVLPTTLDILRLCIFNSNNLHTAQSMQNTLGISSFTFYDALQALHSVLYVPSPETADVEGPRFYHSSFAGFLQDPSRSGDYNISRTSLNPLMFRGPGVLAALPIAGASGTGAAKTTRSSDSRISKILTSHDPAVDVVAGSQQALMSGSRSGTDFTPSDSFQSDIADHNSEVVTLLSGVLKDSRSRKALRNLKSDGAQLVVNYLHSVLLEPSLSIPWLRKHTLIALRGLSKESLLYPHCYVLKDITLGPRESGGAFSDVHKGQHGEQHLCLKVVRLCQKSDTEAMLKIYAKEAILWGQLNHPNVVPFYGIYYLNEERRQVCLVSPWMRNGNLVDYLRNNPSVSRPHFTYDVVAGLEYLHDQSLVHSDIKGMNILVNDSERACITDFGLSFIWTDETLAYSFAGTTAHGFSHHWAAPELLDDDARPTITSDVWALGCVFYEILTGLLPFHGSSDFQIVRKLMKGELPKRPTPMPSPGSAEDAIWKLVDRCWSLEPAERPTCRDISQELKRIGLAREQEEGLEDMIQERQRFRDAMRKNEEVPLDLDRVEQILNQL